MGVEGLDEGGIEVGLVVDLASGPRSCLGKEKKKKKKKTRPGSPASGAAQLPQVVELHSTKKEKERKGGEICISLFS